MINVDWLAEVIRSVDGDNRLGAGAEELATNIIEAIHEKYILVPTNHVLSITTAYEQGVGKGHQSRNFNREIENPYSMRGQCHEAWQIGYNEGKRQNDQMVKRKAKTKTDTEFS